MSSTLFTPYVLGKLELNNRIVMSPLTRSRAIGNVPNDLMALYYRQRASAGLIITEGTSPSPNGLGYARIPGMFNAMHLQGWQQVTDGVHAAGSQIFLQLMHTGRVAHPLNLPPAATILAPSAIAAPGEMWTDQQGQQPMPVPRAMSGDEVKAAITEYAHAAQLAVTAGFDGVELHAANGYLMEQFLNNASNQRTDEWGGSIENRIRFVVEVARASAAQIGAHRVGIRVSPYGVFNGMTSDKDTDALYIKLMQALSEIGIAYVHVVDHSSMGAPPVSAHIKATIRASFNGSYVLSGGYDLARANADLDAGRGDLVAFGRAFISNPDLPHKLESGLPLTPADATAFYTPGEKGYTDYEGC